MSGRGSPRRKVSCSVIVAPPPPRDRPCVLFSGFCQALRKSDEGAHGRALRALWGMRPVAIEPERPGDIEMGPLRPILDGGVEERRSLDGSTFAARAVADIGDLAL